MPPGSADYKVEIVDANGAPDMRVAVVGDQVVNLAGASDGDVLTVQPNGTVAPETPAWQPIDSDLTAIAALSTTSYGRALLALADAAEGRTAFGLGSAATQAASAFDAAGAAAAAQAASQPLDADLTAIAALSTTAYGRALLTLANAAASDFVTKALYDANTVLAATSDDTPAAVSMGAQTFLARLASGNIVAATIAQMRALLNEPLVPLANGNWATGDNYSSGSTQAFTTQNMRRSGVRSARSRRPSRRSGFPSSARGTRSDFFASRRWGRCRRSWRLRTWGTRTFLSKRPRPADRSLDSPISRRRRRRWSTRRRGPMSSSSRSPMHAPTTLYSVIEGDASNG